MASNSAKKESHQLFSHIPVGYIENAVQTWMRDAACVGLWELFDSTDNGSLSHQRYICGVCPVKDECLEYALYLENGVYSRFIRYGNCSPQKRRNIDKVRQER